MLRSLRFCVQTVQKLTAVAVSLALLSQIGPANAAPQSGIECGCTKTGIYVNPLKLVAPEVNGDLTSPDGPPSKYKMTVAIEGGATHITVKRVSTNELLLSKFLPLEVNWGFSPDGDRFVYHYLHGGTHYVFLYNLLKPFEGSPQDVRPIWQGEINISTNSSRLGFSPSGRYFFYAGLVSPTRTSIKVVDATSTSETNNLRYSDEFDFQTIPGTGGEDEKYGMANWGFSPDAANRTLVYAWRTGQTEVTWRRVNLATGEHKDGLLDGFSNFWQFSKCGDMLGLVKTEAAGVWVRLYATHDHALVPNTERALTSVSKIEFYSNAANHFVRHYNSNGSVANINLTANEAEAACPTGLTLALSAPGVTGGSSVTGTVTIGVGAPAHGASVSLSSSNTNAATVPQNVVIPAGETSATFTIATKKVTADSSVTITAFYGGAKTAPLAVLAGVGTEEVTLDPASVIGGGESTGTVKLMSPAPAGGAVVTLASGNPAAFIFLESVTVPAGLSSTTFTIATQGVAAKTDAEISATYKGVTKKATMSILPAELNSFSLTPARVLGGKPFEGRVELTGTAPAGGAVLTLTGDAKNAAVIPEKITVPEGQAFTTFTLTTLPVSAPVTFSLTAAYGAATKTASLTVLPPPVYTMQRINVRKNSFGSIDGINASGQAVGSLFLETGETNPVFTGFTIAPGSTALEGIGVTGASSTRAHGINDAGQIVGEFTVDGNPHAYLKSGTTKDLGSLGGNYSIAYGVNNAGQVVGVSRDASQAGHAFKTDANGENMQSLGFVGFARSINDAGKIVGEQYGPGGAGPTAFLVTPEGEVQNFAAGEKSTARKINNAGMVIGYVQNGDNKTAYLWSESLGFQSLGTVIGDDESVALDVNASGMVVGQSLASFTGQHGFLYAPGVGMQNLDDLVDPDLGMEIQYSGAINDSGVIAGVGYVRLENKSHLFRLTPIAPLESLALTSETVAVGQAVTGTVTLTVPAPEGGAVVTLASGSASVTVPPLVIVPEGAKETTFTATAGAVEAAVPLKITALRGVVKTAGLTVTPSSGSGALKLGDPNGDGSVDVADAVLVLQFIVETKQPTEAQEIAADIENDDTIDVADARKILRIAVGAEPQP